MRGIEKKRGSTLWIENNVNTKSVFAIWSVWPCPQILYACIQYSVSKIADTLIVRMPQL